MRWRDEIVELHEFFEAYFLGTESSLGRAESALAPEFTIVTPDGAESDRAGTLEMLRNGHAHATELSITTTDHRLIAGTDEVVVAGYVEHHQFGHRENHRCSTVVFIADPGAPNGWSWRHVQETWLI